ncbi:MAG: hypothetical protein IJT79_03380 [Ruminococcus sp.]|nr:hypothetical protein [Ruminococcus sp.]
MKKHIITFTTILIISLISLSGFSANAAVVNKFGTTVDKDSDNVTSLNEQNPQTDSDGDDLPARYSSRDLGYTSSVKSQVGLRCWAYASMSTYESLLLKDNLFYGDLNVDTLDVWGSTRDNGLGWQREILNGGFTSIATGYFTSWAGPDTEEDPVPRYGTTALSFYNKSERDDIKRALMRTGSVTANYNDNNAGKSIDKCAYYLPENAVSTISGHSISIVGWDDEYSKDNFTGSYMPESDGAWLCKNSWGEYNTLGGYLWISYEDYFLMNNEYFDEGFSVEGYQQIESNDYLYQNEEFGATYEFQQESAYKQTFFNVFDFSAHGNMLDKVIFETLSAGADYDVYYVPLDSENKPNQDRSKWMKLSEGTTDYRGYICADFEDVLVASKKAAIAVELDTSSTQNQCSLGVCEWLRSEETQEMLFLNESKYGDSFIEYNSELIDLKEYYQNKLGDDIGATFVIKAVTNKKVNTNIKGDVNIDEKIDINDVTYIQLHLVNKIPNLTDYQRENADFNSDGVININDATAIQIRLATGN